ncbi:hypothetical protein WJX75_000750 [Coccomyxa subellipsoidea]|uniref:Uncharacterized protein n=1 Tax=Coccomyxa subellipsoidea TaxID=248742 RepID=A0ABR2Z2J6_9CHLO
MSEEANAIRDSTSPNVSSYESQITNLQREQQTSATKITSLEAENVELKGSLEIIGTFVTGDEPRGRELSHDPQRGAQPSPAPTHKKAAAARLLPRRSPLEDSKLPSVD